MVALTIYTEKFDTSENVFGRGMSGKVFLEETNGISESGQEFNTVDAALSHCVLNDITPERIDYHYVGEDGIQRFRKFNIQK